MRRTLCASLAIGMVVSLGVAGAAHGGTPTPDGPAWALAGAESAASSAHARHRWDNLAQLSARDRVDVVTTRLRTLQGRFVRYTPDDITLIIGGEVVTVARRDVLEVLWRERSHRARNVLASFGVGLAVGIVAGTGCDAARDRDAASRAASKLSLRTGSATHAALRPYPVVYRAPAWDGR